MTSSPDTKGVSISIWSEEWRIKTGTQTYFKGPKEHREISTANWTRTGGASAAERAESVACKAVEKIQTMMEGLQDARNRPKNWTEFPSKTASSNKQKL
jgi:hypothetical protein